MAVSRSSSGSTAIWCPAGFIDYAIFSHNRPFVGMSILMQQVTSLRCRAHAIVRVDESFVQEMPGGRTCHAPLPNYIVVDEHFNVYIVLFLKRNYSVCIPFTHTFNLSLTQCPIFYLISVLSLSHNCRFVTKTTIFVLFYSSYENCSHAVLWCITFQTHMFV